MMTIDVVSRIEPETLPQLERLPRWDTTSVESIRASYAPVRPGSVAPPPEVERTEAVIASPGGQGEVAVRWYRPRSAGPVLPCIVYLHGGGYIMGTLDENDDRLDRFAVELGCAIASVDWRLAPEHPYPAGLDDVESVWRRIAADPTAFGVDRERMAIAGSSAGGGLAAALCLRLRELGERQPRLQLLVYPMLDDREETPSMRAIRGGSGHPGLWRIEAQRLAWRAYLSALPAGVVPATAAPARAGDLSGLAPAFLGVGDLDAFLDEDLAYASRLARDGVPTELHVYPGVIHGGFASRPWSPRTSQFRSDVVAALGAALSTG